MRSSLDNELVTFYNVEKSYSIKRATIQLFQLETQYNKKKYFYFYLFKSTSCNFNGIGIPLRTVEMQEPFFYLANIFPSRQTFQSKGHRHASTTITRAIRLLS